MLALEHRRPTSRGRASARPAQQFDTLAHSALPVIQRVPACACGGSCPRCQAESTLKIGAADDACEREADAVADRAMRMGDAARGDSSSASVVQRKCDACEKEDEEPLLQPKAKSSSASAPVSAPASVDAVLRTPGRALDSETRAFFEPRFGRDLSAVQVHADSAAQQSAREVGAQAYTVGHDIVFGTGRFAPGTGEGRCLLAHELAHVVQQTASVEPIMQRKLDKITQSGCNFAFELGIGIYGPRADAALAASWQNTINSRWSTDIVCASNKNRCPVTMKATVNAYPAKNWSYQIPESNAVYVEDTGYRDISAPLYKHWAKDADELTVAHETGHLMGLYDLYVGKYSLPGFENDIMANYYTDPGPTQYSGALASILFNNRKGCPCCFGASKSKSATADATSNNESVPVDGKPEPSGTSSEYA